MTQDRDATPAQPPEDFQEYSDARFGFKVMMPKRFQILPTTVDPLARMIRGLDDLPAEEQAQLQGRLPAGFWDPEVIGQLEDGNQQPLRLIEYDALRGAEEPLDDEQSERMWREVREYMPKTLKGARMPGYAFIGIEETKLGSLPALAFDYAWDGVWPGHFGGDHVRVVWSLTATEMLQVYHHCSGEEWETRLPELEAILATFELLDQAEMDREAARSVVALDAFKAAKEAGSSESDALEAAQAAYEAAAEAGAAEKDVAEDDVGT
jgi:hypothetical protein